MRSRSLVLTCIFSLIVMGSAGSAQPAPVPRLALQRVAGGLDDPVW